MTADRSCLVDVDLEDLGELARQTEDNLHRRSTQAVIHSERGSDIRARRGPEKRRVRLRVGVHKLA
jgi:hypothetical protein